MLIGNSIINVLTIRGMKRLNFGTCFFELFQAKFAKKKQNLG